MEKGSALRGIGPTVRQNFDVSNDISRYVIELHAASALVAMPV